MPTATDFAEHVIAAAASHPRKITRIKLDFERTDNPDGTTDYNVTFHVSERPPTEAEAEAARAASAPARSDAPPAGNAPSWDAFAGNVAQEINAAYDRGVAFGQRMRDAEHPSDASPFDIEEPS
ncbi:MAG: hypothetical protein Q8S13_09835 [Dehalococcoidia bacterium]|nr:hypothetical protein [Dehalococcoidia bacterium]